ncbi:MAG: alpha-hydroxy acid oxidase [Paracoccaceae bacterium]
MNIDTRYPAISDLRRKAKQRIPHFVWEYLDSGTGTEATTARNRAALDKIGFTPSILHGEFVPDLSVKFLGQDLPLPIGIAPVGMSGLIWPNAERLLANAAEKAHIPYTLSTVAAASPEDVASALGDNAWFQLYPPRDPDIRHDMLRRARTAGFKTLVLTVDVPVASRRERQSRAGLTQPPKLTPRLMAQVAACPKWALGTARHGMPRMRMLDAYKAGSTQNLPSTAHIGYLLRTSPDWDYVKWLRDNWDGPFIVKGVMRPDDANRLAQMGVDAIWVSNHSGRQFDASLSSIEVLPDIRSSCDVPLIFDSGIEGGLDILRALAMGADFVMLGRAWHFALAALGSAGPAHLIEILRNDLLANMGQLGVKDLAHLPHPIDLT